jgi:excisionase family DNA binding protein
MHPKQYAELRARSGAADPGRSDKADANDAAMPVEAKRKPGPPPHVDPILVTIVAAAAMLGLSRTTIFNLIAEGELTVVRYGPRRTLVVVQSIRDFVDRRATKAGRPGAPAKHALPGGRP